jgi:hypothetical protein
VQSFLTVKLVKKNIESNKISILLDSKTVQNIAEPLGIQGVLFILAIGRNFNLTYRIK